MSYPVSEGCCAPVSTMAPPKRMVSLDANELACILNDIECIADEIERKLNGDRVKENCGKAMAEHIQCVMGTLEIALTKAMDIRRKLDDINSVI